MKAFILSGGFGSKLREVVFNQPKILAPIKAKAFIDHLFFLLKQNGFTEVVMGLGYLGNQVKDYLINRPLYDLSIMYSLEDRPLGTAGSLKKASKYLDTTFFVINGDTYLDFDYKKALAFHQSKKADVTVIFAKNKYSSGFGSAQIDKDDRILDFSSDDINKKNQYVHAGIYIFEPSVVKFIPEHKNSSIEKDLIPLLIQKKSVYIYKTNKPFIDIGDSEGYKLAHQHLKR